MDTLLFPSEVLTNIFKFLDLEDRKNVRLTCYQWYTACNAPNIIKNEKFVFHCGNDDNMQCLSTHIRACTAFRAFIKFEGLSLDELPSDIWQLCGDQILSLFIDNCFIDDKTMENIITHCFNMVHFCIQLPDKYHHYGSFFRQFHMENSRGENFLYSGNTFEELIKKKIERRKLISLKLYTCFIPNKMLRNIFQIFPCIQELSQGSCSLSDEISREILNKKDCSCTVYHYNMLSICPFGGMMSFGRHDIADNWILPPLIKNCIWNYSDTCIPQLSQISHIRFKEFGIKLCGVRKDDEKAIGDMNAIFNFFSCQTELEKIMVRSSCGLLDSFSPRHLKALLFHLLESSPILKDFQLTDPQYGDIEFSISEYKVFLLRTNQLESLILNTRQRSCKLKDSFPVNFPEISSTKYTKLKKLHLNFFKDENIIFDLLSRCTKSLLYLYLLKLANDRILQKVFEIHTDLKTLGVSLKSCSSFGLTGHKLLTWGRNKHFSIRRLKTLQYLEIWKIPVKVLADSVSEFCFPKLKYFSINLLNDNQYHKHRFWTTRHVYKKMLNRLSRSSPCLEVLRFWDNLLQADDLLTFRGKFNKLKFLFIMDTQYQVQNSYEFQGLTEDVEEMKKLFLTFKSLHWIVNHYSHDSYFFDRFSNEVKCYKNFEPSIDKYKVDDHF